MVGCVVPVFTPVVCAIRAEARRNGFPIDHLPWNVQTEDSAVLMHFKESHLTSAEIAFSVPVRDNTIA